ncbi:MAG: DUF2652 domain-containing protein, partial [Chloroflexi bacterium]|nr:DUF2652 domain-containing protein [Chloroflexota bacterium]
METKTQHGYLLLADISGYTSFVAGTELEHAHEILTELLAVIVKRFQQALTISKLEGDAVFAYVPEFKFTRGEALIELIEATYVAFRDTQVNMHHRTTCTCSACRAIPTLDLKFFAHHGDYIIQDIMGSKELVGSDVNLIHRLMKNHVSEATGWKAYTLFTQKGLEHVGISNDGMHPQVENYEHLGDVQTYSDNLHERYQQIIETRRVFLEAKDADAVYTQEFDAPPAIVWDWWNNPLNRDNWDPAGHNRWRLGTRLSGGRTGVGARNHCAHGKDDALEEITDWRPFDYVSLISIVSNMSMPETVIFEPIDDGRRTRVYDHINMEIPLPKFLRRLIVRPLFEIMAKYTKMLQHSSDLLNQRLAEKEN